MSPSVCSLTWSVAGDGTLLAGQIPATDRGFRYGMSVFETVALFHGHWLFADEHMERLARACHAADFPFPRQIGWDLLGLVTQEIRNAGCDHGVLRLYVTAGEGGVSSPVAMPRVFVLFEDIPFPTEAEIAQGYTAAISPAVFPCILGGWKSGNYWPHIQALREARHYGVDEILLFNAQGSLVSAAMANVFVVIDGRLCTPARECGARDGVIRQWVMAQTGVEETLLAQDDVVRAQEIFLTNSRLGVMPVAAIQDRPLSVRPISTDLARHYREDILSSGH